MKHLKRYTESKSSLSTEKEYSEADKLVTREKAEKRPTVQNPTPNWVMNPTSHPSSIPQMNFEDVNMKTYCRFLYKPINR